MQKDIHPTYHDKARISCACGAKFTVGSTVESVAIEICSTCHPFYTGKQKLVDTARRVDKFQKRVALKDSVGKERKGKAAKRATRTAKQSTKDKKLKLTDLVKEDKEEKKTATKAPAKKSAVATKK